MCKPGFLGGGDPGPALWQESKQVANLRGYIQGMFLGLESKIDHEQRSLLTLEQGFGLSCPSRQLASGTSLYLSFPY